MTVLTVDHVEKRYASYRSNLDRFANWFGAGIPPAHEFRAVDDISFSLDRGQSVALIGQNGAGKSTLLKLITGTIRPSGGRVSVGGRISAILELGLGFNPEFTGRQNVLNAGGLMGLSQKDLQELMPSIEAFAEIGEFIDEPLRVYSSGMQARLAFALATAKRPDLLIVDEVLSVGDSYFQHKSFDRIRQFKEEGTSILLVTHAMGDVRALCDRVILLDKGKVLKDGLPDEIVDYYNALIAERENAKLTLEQRRNKQGWLQSEFGSRDAVMERIELVDRATGEPINTARVGQTLSVKSWIRVTNVLDHLVIGHRITDRTGHVIWGTNTWHTGQQLARLAPGDVIVSTLDFDCELGPGSYAVNYGLHRNHTHIDGCYHKAENAIVFDVVNSDRPYFIGSAALKAKFTICQQ
ncbi:MAG: ABC transporter ATP-binding protein [Pararhizobium sp.]